MLQHLTRGIGILEESEFNSRRNAEQMKQTIADMQGALEKVQGMREEGWSEENWQQELTKALTTGMGDAKIPRMMSRIEVSRPPGVSI